uniref:PH domain-containing protein n=1 Tax=Sinocyclocheilus rhinocerous TaxID=307959 RepID=A0A673MVW0_9TELE
MSNNKKSPVEELYTGYLVKSPPLTKSWKNRFFVLSKIGEDTYQLTYHVNERRDKPLGAIDISKISLLFTSPETHQKWDWVKKQSKGSPSSVLFLKVEDVTLKQSREYFLIGKNSADVDGWLNALFKAMKTQKSQNKLPHTDDTQDKRSRSMTLPANCSEPNGEDQPDDRWSAFELTSLSQCNHYDYPRKLSEPPIPVTCNKELCGSQNDLTNSLILTQEGGKPCVSKCGEIEASSLFHKGDQILAVNDLLTDTVEEVQTYLRKLSKSEVKLTIRRLPGSIPLNSEPC